ncbi:hypothetical protein ABI214_00145 [Prescottella soli]|uniref:Uncharacterized protein n=1 Tax=Prescottella soli TaxID=1543852 RepID=A0ABW9FZX2_9NOCA
MKRSLLVRAGALAIGLMALGSGVANAQDAWPVDPGEGNAIRPEVATDYVLMPDQPEFWNPRNNMTRVISPYGRTTKIVCTGYRVDTSCWQADPAGNHTSSTSYSAWEPSAPSLRTPRQTSSSTRG